MARQRRECLGRLHNQQLCCICGVLCNTPAADLHQEIGSSLLSHVWWALPLHFLNVLAVRLHTHKTAHADCPRVIDSQPAAACKVYIVCDRPPCLQDERICKGMKGDKPLNALALLQCMRLFTLVQPGPIYTGYIHWAHIYTYTSIPVGTSIYTYIYIYWVVIMR